MKALTKKLAHLKPAAAVLQLVTTRHAIHIAGTSICTHSKPMNSCGHQIAATSQQSHNREFINLCVFDFSDSKSYNTAHGKGALISMSIFNKSMFWHGLDLQFSQQLMIAGEVCPP